MVYLLLNYNNKIYEKILQTYQAIDAKYKSFMSEVALLPRASLVLG